MADAAASKAAEATHVGSTPTFPTIICARIAARNDATDRGALNRSSANAGSTTVLRLDAVLGCLK